MGLDGRSSEAAKQLIAASGANRVERGRVGGGRGGHGALSIGAISAAPGTSNQTFDENFGKKQEAFLAAFSALIGQALKRTAVAFVAQADWPASAAAGIVALQEHFATPS